MAVSVGESIRSVLAVFASVVLLLVGWMGTMALTPERHDRSCNPWWLHLSLSKSASEAQLRRGWQKAQRFQRINSLDPKPSSRMETRSLALVAGERMRR